MNTDTEELTPKKKRDGQRNAVIVCSAAAIAAAAAAFVFYAVKSHGGYKFQVYILPFLTLAAFTAAAVIMMPRLIEALSGKRETALPALDGEPDRPKNVKRNFLIICGAALLLHILTGFLGTICYWLLAESTERSLSLAELWRIAWMKPNTDVMHYLDIADHWYVTEGDERLFLVFFPMFPALVGRLNVIFGDLFFSAQVLNTAATCLTAGMTYLTLLPILGNRRSVCGAFIFLLLPGAIFMNSPMTEPLFMLFTVCCFYCIGKKRFIAAGIFTALAGYTRSLGVLMAVPLAIAGVGTIVGLMRERKPWLKQALILLAALAISTIGTLEYLYLNYSLYGKLTQFLVFQESNWHQQASPFFDTPRYYMERIGTYLNMGAVRPVLSLWVSGYIAIFGSLALMISRARKLPAEYTAFFLCYFAVSIGCTWLLSGPRYICAALPVTAAIALSCDKKWKIALTFAICALLYVLYMWMYMLRLDIY